MSKNNIKELSIQVNLNGLSFCILNRTSNTIELLQSLPFLQTLNPFDVLNRLKTELSANSSFSAEFDAVNVIHQNELSTLVPRALYNDNNKADYLKFNTKILKTDFITQDEIVVNDSVNVYIPYININNYIFETFGAFTYKHSSTVLIDTLLQNSLQITDLEVHLHVNSKMLEISVIDKGQLQLFNVFQYHRKEDFIYYVLFVFEQLNLDVETTVIYLSGTINRNDDLYNVLYTYIRHVEFETLNLSYSFSELIDTEQLHNHYLILNTFLMRIISGTYKGRKIVAPAKLPVRPTTDMAKEALFNILNNQYYFNDISVLDLFAGTGNISYEFASRGTEDITAIDDHYQCTKFISLTAEALEMPIKAIKSDVFKFLENSKQQYSIIFADPPYNFSKDLFSKIPQFVFENNLLYNEGLLIIEHSKHTDLSDLYNYSHSKKYGGNMFSFFEHSL